MCPFLLARGLLRRSAGWPRRLRPCSWDSTTAAGQEALGLTCRAKNFEFALVLVSRMASTRVYISGCSCSARMTRSAAARWAATSEGVRVRPGVEAHAKASPGKCQLCRLPTRPCGALLQLRREHAPRRCWCWCRTGSRSRPAAPHQRDDRSQGGRSPRQPWRQVQRTTPKLSCSAGSQRLLG